MCKNLRKVIFSLGKRQFIPDCTQKEEQEQLELCRKRFGYFHRWVEDLDCSKEIPYIKPMALVEDTADGKMYLTDYDNVQFQTVENEN